MKMRALIVSTALVVLMGGTAAGAQETPRMGGVLKVASVGEPPTLDIAMSTAPVLLERLAGTLKPNVMTAARRRRR